MSVSDWIETVREALEVPLARGRTARADERKQLPPARTVRR
jgi:hypothetical protein